MKHFFKKSLASFISLAILLGSFGGLLYLGEGKGASAAFYAVQAPATTLYYGISSSASSARLRSFNDIYGTKLTMAMFGTIGYVTFEPGVPGKEEVVSFTGITDNGDGTQTITGLTRGLISRGPTYGLGGTGRYHGSNTYVTVSNAGEFYNQFAIKQNNEAVTGLWTFNSYIPMSSITATNSQQFVTKSYADGLSFAGVATATESSFGGVWLATALQAASSTPTTANTPYVMQAQNATDTPTAGCATGYTSTAGAGCSVIATLAGKIKQTFLDIFTTDNTWSGTQTFSATTTINSDLIIRGGGASSTVLIENGYGRVRFMDAGLALAYTAYPTMSTTTGNKIAHSISVSFSSCTSATPVKVAEYKIWRYGTVLAVSTSTVTGGSDLSQYSMLFVVNNTSTTTKSISGIASGVAASATTTFSVVPGDTVQLWCTEDSANANPSVGGFSLFATSTVQNPVITVGTEQTAY